MGGLLQLGLLVASLLCLVPHAACRAYGYRDSRRLEELLDDETDGRQAPTVKGNPPGCDQSFTYQYGGCYRLTMDKLDWPAAQLRCQSYNKNAHLVFINNSTKDAAVLAILTNAGIAGGASRVWTGGQRLYTPNGASSFFVWKKSAVSQSDSDLRLVTYTNWYTGYPVEPNNINGNEGCIDFWPYWDKWSDYQCTNPVPSLCEIDMP